MEKKTMLIIVGVVVAIAVIGAAAFVLMGGGGGGQKVTKYTGETDSDFNRLLVYGNANNDNYLNKDDVKLIQSMIDGTFVYDVDDYPLADANCDGKITSADVDLVNKFIKGQSATMYYVDWNLEVSKINYPLTGKVAVPYDSSLWIGQIVGFYEDITYMSRTASFVDNLREDMFPGAADRIEAQGGTKNYEYDVERLVNADISIVLGDKNAITDNYLDKVKKNKSIQTILLPENREHSGLNWSNSVITLGAMMNKQANTREYISYLEDVSTVIEEAVEEASATHDKKTYLLVYCDPEEAGWYLDVRGTDAEVYGDVVNCDKLPLTCAIGIQPGDGYVATSVENIMAIDPDVIIFSTWGPFMGDWSMDEYKELVHLKLDYLKETTAYKTGQCYSISYEVYGTLPGLAGLVYLGSQIWPDLFDEDEGLEYLQDYFDLFTMISGTDVRTVTGLLPLIQEDIE